MARLKDREKAIALRKQKMSYSQIKKVIKVSKGTLSIWLKDYPLSKERIRELRDCNEQRIERFRETMRDKRQRRLDETYKIQKSKILPLDNKELFIAGLMLYWGEGSKYKRESISISNSNPAIITFFISWLIKCFKVKRDKVKIYLQLYNNMDTDKEIDFWSKELNIPKIQFGKPYIKKTSSLRINHKGGFGHGTCNARIDGVRLAEKIFMSIKVIGDRYNKRA